MIDSDFAKIPKKGVHFKLIIEKFRNLPGGPPAIDRDILARDVARRIICHALHSLLVLRSINS